MQAIYQAPTPPGWSKVRVFPARAAVPWVYDWDRRVRNYWDTRRDHFGDVEQWQTLSPASYDNVLASSVILTELFDASANNVVIECIARATPLVINRHPAVVEYLGEDYPLFFDQIGDVAGLLAPDRIDAAHRYLLARDKTKLAASFFATSLRNALSEFC